MVDAALNEGFSNLRFFGNDLCVWLSVYKRNFQAFMICDMSPHGPSDRTVASGIVGVVVVVVVVVLVVGVGVCNRSQMRTSKCALYMFDF